MCFFGLQLRVCLWYSRSPFCVYHIIAQLPLKKYCQTVTVYLYVFVRNTENVFCLLISCYYVFALLTAPTNTVSPLLGSSHGIRYYWIIFNMGHKDSHQTEMKQAFLFPSAAPNDRIEIGQEGGEED